MDINGWWHDSNRSGEGLLIHQRENECVAALFSFTQHDPNDGDVTVKIDRGGVEILSYPEMLWMVSDLFAPPQDGTPVSVDFYRPIPKASFVRDDEPTDGSLVDMPENPAVATLDLASVEVGDDGVTVTGLRLTFDTRTFELDQRIFP